MKVVDKSDRKNCPTRSSSKSATTVAQEWKSLEQECEAKASHKSVLEEYARMPSKSGRKIRKSVPEDCCARVSSKSALQECPARVP